MKKKRKRPKRSNFKTFTKKWVEKLMWIAEELSRTVVVEIIGVMLGYFRKSYLETRESEKIRLQEDEDAPVQPVEEMEDENYE